LWRQLGPPPGQGGGGGAAGPQSGISVGRQAPDCRPVARWSVRRQRTRNVPQVAPPPARHRLRGLAVILALLAIPTLLLAPAMPPGRALLPADLLVQFQPWRSQLASPPTRLRRLGGTGSRVPWRHFAAGSCAPASCRCGTVSVLRRPSSPATVGGAIANVLFWVPTAVAFVWSASCTSLTDDSPTSCCGASAPPRQHLASGVAGEQLHERGSTCRRCCALSRGCHSFSPL
jgi:hypothetical protein